MRKVFVEGPPDLILVRVLGFTRKTSKSLGPKGEVCNYLGKHTEIIGLVDEDPATNPQPYLKKLKIKQLEHNLLVYFDSKNKNRVVALRPRLEEWIIKICKDAKVSLPKDFGLPDTPKDLHEVLTSRLPKFEALIVHLLELKNPALLLLQRHLLEK